MSAVRKTNQLIFSCDSPSVWVLLGAPVVLAYNGKCWVLSMTDRLGVYREGQYPKRTDAIQFLEKYYGKCKIL